MAAKKEISIKLNATTKKSTFEQSKAEAEAKKARDDAETAAALEDFVKSFEGEDDTRPYAQHARAAFPPPASGKRHFSNTNLKSGPGSLGPVPLRKSGPGSLGPVNQRGRPFEDPRDRRSSGSYHVHKESTRSSKEDDDEEQAAAKPTVHLALMPPGTSPSAIRALLADTPLSVEHIRVLPGRAPDKKTGERNSVSAIVTLAADTPATDIDSAVSRLQNRYLGYGFRLSISRHLSSAAAGTNTIVSSSTNSLPFGAKPVEPPNTASRGPAAAYRFAPPSSLTSSTPVPRLPTTQVTIQPQSNLRQLELIHGTLEGLLEHGPDFEAVLAVHPEVQNGEDWAWFWDQNSPGGVYYRWRLWKVLTAPEDLSEQPFLKYEALFENQSFWMAPEDPVKFQFITELDQLVDDSDYNSSEDDDDDEDEGGDLTRRYNDHNTVTTTVEDNTNDGEGLLNPLAKAELVHSLRRLPDTTSKLTKADVARVTAFAIKHAGAGGEEIAAILTHNVIAPFQEVQEDDTSSASLIGLYLISDVLSTSASAGVRHAWRYRTLFEQSLSKQKIFGKLGRAEKDYKWGKLKAEKFKRSIQALLHVWEGWSVFPHSSQEGFTAAFLNPPLTAAEIQAAEDAAARKAVDETQTKTKSRWRTVDDDKPFDSSYEDANQAEAYEAFDQLLLGYSTDDNIDGTPIVDSSDDDDVGAPMVDSSDEDNVESVKEANTDKPDVTKTRIVDDRTADKSIQLTSAQPAPARRQRPRAADMFADGSE